MCLLITCPADLDKHYLEFLRKIHHALIWSNTVLHSTSQLPTLPFIVFLRSTQLDVRTVFEAFLLTNIKSHILMEA